MPIDHPIREAILHDVTTQVIRRAKRDKGRSLVPGGHNACGATLSQYVCGRLCGPYKAAYNLAQNLINALEQGHKVERVPADMANQEAGLIVVCMDLNGNHLTDHVGISLGYNYKGKLAGKGNFWMVDNQRADPYPRNIGSGPKTPVLYCLRIIA